MSLILNDSCTAQWNPQDECEIEDLRNAAALDRYLAILEANRTSSRFIPDDALLALDMAGFVSGELRNTNLSNQVSVGRLALALVQPHHSDTPLQ